MKKTLTALLMILAISLCVLLCACQNTDKDIFVESTTDEVSSDTDTKLLSDNSNSSDTVTSKANVTSDGMIDASDIFSDRDLEQTADLTGATEHTLSDNDTYTINKEGVYVISGSANNAQIIVDADSQDKVQIVLKSASVTNTGTPVIYVKSADKVFITTSENTENNLTVSGTFSSDGTTSTDAVIFSKDDITINGLGTLTIKSSDNGISCKDDLKITGGTINIESTSDAIEANDSIAVSDGNISINSGKDGLHSENDDDDSKGYVYICGGSFSINASSDGIQGTTITQIDDGNITIDGSEGIEATCIQINNGTVDIKASDDGINASQKSSQYSCTIEINNGNVSVDMGQGDTDALDSNGSIYINGGTVNITAQSPFDYDTEGKLSGGTVTVNGEQVSELTNQFGGMMGGNQGGFPGGMGNDQRGNSGGFPGGGMNGNPGNMG